MPCTDEETEAQLLPLPTRETEGRGDVLGARDGQDRDPRLAGTIQSHGELPGKLGLSVHICEMNGQNRNSAPHRGAWGESRGEKGATCPIRSPARDCAMVIHSGEQNPPSLKLGLGLGSSCKTELMIRGLWLLQ